MNNFLPLYDILVSDLKNSKIEKEDKKLLERITTLTEQQQEIVYALIMKHVIDEGSEVTYYPCDMTFEKDTPVMTIKNLPKKLRSILILYVKKTLEQSTQ